MKSPTKSPRSEKSRSVTPKDRSPAKTSGPVRTPQACDRCRIKKAKCMGGNPCSKCRISDSLCVFGQKSKANRIIYPKGYVEMLERQQKQLVAGVQVLYRKVTGGEPWHGNKLPEYDNHPRIHDVLAALGLIQPRCPDSQVAEFQEHLPNLDGEDLDENVISAASDMKQEPSISSDHADPMQFDAWTPYFEAELAALIESSKHEWSPETEAVVGKSLPTIRPTVLPHCPVMIPLGCTSTFLDDPLPYRPEWMLESQMCDLKTSASPTTLPGFLQPFEFNIDPASLSTNATFSRRGYTM